MMDRGSEKGEPVVVADGCWASRGDRDEDLRIQHAPGWLLEAAVAKPPRQHRAQSDADAKLPPESEIRIPPERRVDRARAYLATIPPAITREYGGSGGCHPRTYYVALLLRRGYILGFRDSWDLIQEWNKRCQPEWSDAEIRHKLVNAATDGRMEYGRMLGHWRASGVSAAATPSTAANGSSATATSTATSSSTPPPLANLFPIHFTYIPPTNLARLFDSSIRAAATIHGFVQGKGLEIPDDLDFLIALATVRAHGDEASYVDLMQTCVAGAYCRSLPDPVAYCKQKHAEALIAHDREIGDAVPMTFLKATIAPTKLLKKRDAAQVRVTVEFGYGRKGGELHVTLNVLLGAPNPGELAGEWLELLAALPNEADLQAINPTTITSRKTITGNRSVVRAVFGENACLRCLLPVAPVAACPSPIATIAESSSGPTTETSS